MGDAPLGQGTDAVRPQQGTRAADLRAAQAYEDLLVPQLFGPSSRRAVALAALWPGDAVLDVACGTGIGVRLAASAVGAAGRVVGIDTDPAMLAVGRRTVREVEPEVQWLQASATALPIADGSFDVCLCLQGLQFFADGAQALSEMRRVLKAGGRLVLTTWGPLATMPGHAAVYAALQRQGIDTASPQRGFALGDVEALRALAERAGFAHVDVTPMTEALRFDSARRFVEGLLSGAPYTRRVIAGLSPQARAECLDEARAALARFETPHALVLPAHVNLLHARGG